MVVCSDVTSSGNASGLRLENGTAMNIKQEVCRIHPRTRLHDKTRTPGEGLCVFDDLVLSAKCCSDTAPFSLTHWDNLD